MCIHHNCSYTTVYQMNTKEKWNGYKNGSVRSHDQYLPICTILPCGQNQKKPMSSQSIEKLDVGYITGERLIKFELKTIINLHYSALSIYSFHRLSRFKYLQFYPHFSQCWLQQQVLCKTGLCVHLCVCVWIFFFLKNSLWPICMETVCQNHRKKNWLHLNYNWLLFE